MNTNKKTARIVGVLFLIAMVVSLSGVVLMEPLLNAPDYLINISENETKVTTVMFFELINAASVIGIVVFLFPILKKLNEPLALGYIGFRIIESVASVASGVGLLSLLTLSREYVVGATQDIFHLQTLGTLLIEARVHWGFALAIFFSLSALILYYLLYQSKLVPRFISVWGLIAVVMVLAVNLSNIFGISLGAQVIALALPIILNEIFLAIWLIVKGFNPSAIASESAKTVN